MTTKKAECIRNVSSWSHVLPEHKFDNIKYNKKEILDNISILSPKITLLLKKIQELDNEDLKNDGKLYKHLIYSDVAGTNGAKMIASSLIALGYNNSYDNKLKMKSIEELKKTKTKNFSLLTSSVVYKKPLSVKLKKNILEILNSRPDNIYGDLIRFLIIDHGYKEGIDVFDIKYLHLLDPVITKSEETQIIGRGTRLCGQMGLPFNSEYGWRLNVYKYNMKYDESIDIFQLYLKYTNININTINFTAELEDILITSAVDIPLTLKIHNSLVPNRFKILGDKLISDDEELKKSKKKNDKLIKNAYGKYYINDYKFDCKKGCSTVLQTVSVGLLLIGALYSGIYKEQKVLSNIFIEKFPRPYLCRFIPQIPKYCKIVNDLWTQPINFFKKNGKKILSDIYNLKKNNKITENNYNEMIKFIYEFKSSEKEIIEYIAEPPENRLTYILMQNYIKNHYKSYMWDKINITNLCEEQKTDIKDDNKIVKFTLSQDFVRNYFIPKSPYNGLLLYHSVGTGKTCTGISIASEFEKEDYTILWVTRHTLKQDIWKNMFDKICNTIIQDKVLNNNIKIPEKFGERMELLGNKWIQPISYKQFSNMIQGKNEYYKKIVSINGKEDPFKKTLIIIDEIHKIFSSDLKKIEKPNHKILKNMIQSSYKKSGKDSCRLLLMTATPITDDPLSAIKILNLLLPEEDQFTENYNDFLLEYCNENGIFTENGTIKFLNKTSGYISYLNRSKDLRQFAYPIINNLIADISNIKKEKSDINKEIDLLDKNKPIDYNKKIKILKNELKKIDKNDYSVKTMINKCLLIK
jgi:superfamily II DNA or RNA helicase